jgi:hypothetical protein
MKAEILSDVNPHRPLALPRSHRLGCMEGMDSLARFLCFEALVI